ncbi:MULTISPECIES: DNA methyltransferase [unclassified Marinobacter]|jgi:DNA modification methylase|uniref:DNA methyltransferase n=1 Tax=unclassified Marinobacter TaxID=83889 RepID=UPI000C8EAC76|nr:MULTISPECIES: DNA methyltransferase [unclassified Marinobacter]MAK49099.1 DNA methylase [Marinobacter sp.]|tara:strand:+ start:5940 stop:8768 length:2829 start_codon:yes stop_codon:yes gene_type:complete
MNQLFDHQAEESGPVECLGQTFPSDEARRAHFLQLLSEKLKDPDFRNQEGFPIGTDEAILEMSDPPYYTACPNPFVTDFCNYYGKAFDSSVQYIREPYTVDVSEGKNDPIYTSHSYHTKVPHKAIMRYILHYTEPGDVVLDGFCGTGMTGVAARLCGDKAAVESLGYRVDKDGRILSLSPDGWVVISRLGDRHSVLNDLSSVAGFIAHNFNSPLNIEQHDKHSQSVINSIEKDLGWMFLTLHNPTEQQLKDAIAKIDNEERLTGIKSAAKINYTVWSDVFSCPECAQEIVYWDTAVDKTTYQVRDTFSCPSCQKNLAKKDLERSFSNTFDPIIGSYVNSAKRKPALIHYSLDGKYFTKSPDSFDFALLRKIQSLPKDSYVPEDPLYKGDKTSDPLSVGITHQHQFYTRRNLQILARYRELIKPTSYAFNLTSVASVASLMYRFRSQNGSLGAGGGPMSGTLYVPSLIKEIPATKLLREHQRKTYKMKRLVSSNGGNIISTGSMSALPSIKNSSIDYIFLDPPFGGNLMYSELNYLSEGWLAVKTNNAPEAIQNKSQRKGLDVYRSIMTNCFKEAFRVLKPGRWLTVEFSNSKASVWNAIQTALQEAGFVVANVSALNKKQGSFNAVNNKTSVKQDLVISAYKPSEWLEDRFSEFGVSTESVWAFVESHLQKLPLPRVKETDLEFVPERDPRILFDRMVAWFFQHGASVPLSSIEFQGGLAQRYPERDGMIFSADQVAKYDKKRATIDKAPQMELFVSDERSAIDWLSKFLKKKPSTYQDIHPEFTTQLGAGWKKHEEKPELKALLESNFLKYDGIGDVPSQIHSYLSTNHKDLRSLEKDDPRLISRAKDRWYVPDPNKAHDLEKRRERALLKEFETYKEFSGRRLKEFRLEVLRAGFKDAYSKKDYQTIVSIAKKIPEESLQEDEKLLLWYDQALTRTEGAI